MIAQQSDNYYNCFLIPLRKLNVTDAEMQFMRILGFFVPVIGLSPQGRKAVADAQEFYTTALHDTIVLQHPEMTPVEVALRMGQLMSILPNLEVSYRISIIYDVTIATI